MHPRLMYALSDVCVCGHAFGRHRGVPEGEPAPCKADDDTCPCRSFALAPPTDVSELRERDTLPPAPADPNTTELRSALAHVANLCVDLIQRLDLGERRFAHVERRLDKIERHLGIAPAE